MSISVEIWQPGAQVNPSSTTLFFRAPDEIALRAALGAVSKPRLISLTPNGELRKDFVAAFLGAGSDPLTPHCPRLFPIHNIPAREIFASAVRLSLALRELDTGGVIAACDDLDAATAHLQNASPGSVPVALPRVVSFLRILAEEALHHLEFSSPLVHNSTGDSRKSWWTVSIPYAATLAALRRRLIAEFGGATPPGLAAVDTWLSTTESRLKRLMASPLTSATRQSAILEASAYCGAIAERYLRTNQLGRAILMLHRSADLLLLYRCALIGAIQFTLAGGKYAPSLISANEKNMISIRLSLDILAAHLSSPSTRSADLDALNDWRNLLMETHYMTAPAEQAVLNVFFSVRPHLESLGGSDWITARNHYLLGIELAPTDLLDADRSLSQSVSEIQY